MYKTGITYYAIFNDYEVWKSNKSFGCDGTVIWRRDGVRTRYDSDTVRPFSTLVKWYGVIH